MTSLSKSKAFLLSASSLIWVFLSGLALSYLPQIAWIGRPDFRPNIYFGVGLKTRLMKIFFHWDAQIYADLAIHGYPRLPESWKYAFFPGWPKILGSISALFSVQQTPLVLYVGVGLNFFLGALAVWSWSKVLEKVLNARSRKYFLGLLLFFPTSVFYFTCYPEWVYRWVWHFPFGLA